MDALRIDSHLRSLSGIGQLAPRPEMPSLGQAQSPTAAAPGDKSFKDVLSESVDKVNNMLLDSDKAIEGLASGQSTNIHGTLIAMQKAELSLKTLMEIRTKVIKAYEEVMRTQT